LLFTRLEGRLGKFQNWHHPKNHEYDGEINETWDNYFSGTALTGCSAMLFYRKSRWRGAKQIDNQVN